MHTKPFSKSLLLPAILLSSAPFIFGCSNQSTDANSVISSHSSQASQRQQIDFNFGWKFINENVTGAEQTSFNDVQWRDVRLPHDWSIEKPYSQELTAGATGYLPGGHGWYRKHFKTPKLANGETAKTQILFDGIYNHSEVFINGKSLGTRPYGYAPFYYDLTPYLNTDSTDNVIAVSVDRSRYVDSRWYTGSGFIVMLN
ncbi:sugar-binding domain-containing protein [Catenovulum agarivorans]|uniref:sugar-binding domain-containing protein n=1 Tax=Catenovulum agarivorans TaxID=1172192 RepID=UPI0004BBDB47|nr:sugar-binding domain-containing protein [Catenovulum agarivorans]